jgi:hypothetical protein
MSQFSIRNIREISNDPLTKFTNTLAKRIAQFINKQETDKLENGPEYGDEINLVDPGFNSGWTAVLGLWKREGGLAGDLALIPEDLVDFHGSEKYSAPEFMWYYTVGPTALKLLNSDKLGKQYENDMFVGVVNYGTIYHFGLNNNRTELALNGLLTS